MKWLPQCFGISKQAFYKRLNSYEIKINQEEILIKLVKYYRKRVGQKIGGLKLYSELKSEFESHNKKNRQ